MHTKSFHGVKHSLTKNEMVILKSIALGLDCDTIRLLVEISEYQYHEVLFIKKVYLENGKPPKVLKKPIILENLLNKFKQRSKY